MQKTFGNIIAELEPNDDREGVNCYVTCGKHHSSLDLLNDYGTVGFDGPKVRPDVIEKIEAWALANGY